MPSVTTRAGVGSGADDGPRRTIGLRIKLLVAFSVAFTAIFVVLAWLIIMYVSDTAQERVVQQLKETAVGGATTLDASGLRDYLRTVPSADPGNPYQQGNPAYRALNEELMRIRTVVPNASPYTYYVDPEGANLRWLTSWAAIKPIPDFTVKYRTAVADIVDAGTVALMREGLEGTVEQPPYFDENGGWISTYTPIRDESGTVVAGLGIDYPLEYVDAVRRGALETVVPVLVVSYLVLLAMVFLVSTWLTRPLKRLTAAAHRIADGDYGVDLSAVAPTRIPDEMAVLADTFQVMVDKIGARERSLAREVTRLKVEIDAQKKEAAVTEIIESDFFAGIAEKSAIMRQRMKALDGPDAEPSSA